MAEILIIDDEKEMLNGCARILKALGHEPVAISSGKQATHLMESHDFDLILCDLFMPEMDGIEVLQVSLKLLPDTPLIICSAFGTIERAVSAMRLGAFDFLEKPFEVEHLKIALEKGLRQREFFNERNDLRRQLEGKSNANDMVGRSSVMLKLNELISTVAQTDSNVIITGESGTGKELVARSIHTNSDRHNKAFIPVNCGALPENLFESELFGYEKGAFTGAHKRKPGLLEMAHNGTFFLDEMCELTAALQVKLLRVLQERQVMRVGGEQVLNINVRFIAATNRDVEKYVEEGKLREDFYYRLNVVRIHVPPLRERRADIRLLAEHFLQKLLKSSPKSVTNFEQDVLQILEQYDWPGNVRELENVIERSLALTKNETITTADLPPQFQEVEITESYANLKLVEAKQQMVEKFERSYILTLLKKHHGNVTKIAEDAGMTRRNLHRLLNRYGYEASTWRTKK